MVAAVTLGMPTADRAYTESSVSTADYGRVALVDAGSGMTQPVTLRNPDGLPITLSFVTADASVDVYDGDSVDAPLLATITKPSLRAGRGVVTSTAGECQLPRVQGSCQLHETHFVQPLRIYPNQGYPNHWHVAR